MTTTLQSIESQMETAYLDYAVAVLQERAIPDIRDGLKPSQRRILLSFYDDNRWSTAPFVKCAKITGRVMQDYHPHGEMVIYPTLVRMAQSWSLRYPLVDPQGNFGSQSGAGPAAQRYTEAKLTKTAEDILDDLQVDKQWSVITERNYSDSLDEATVLPSKVPNLLINGSIGIAVGWATCIPPFNLVEVCDALTALVKNSSIEDEKLFKLISGPDFPTGGIIHGTKGIHELYKTGKGHITVTGKVKINEDKKGPTTITVIELPYGVSTLEFKEKADEAHKLGRLTGVSKLTDASSRRLDNPVQIIFTLKKGEDPRTVINQLYEHTPLRENFAGNMIALVEGKDGVRIPSRNPLSLRELMNAWISFRKEVVIRRTSIRLNTTNKRIMQLEGRLIALNNIDKVIKIIKTAEEQIEIFKIFKDEFDLSETQSKDILELQIRNLMRLERDALKSELEDKKDKAKEYKNILKDPKLVDGIIIDELQDISKRYGDERRTSIESEFKEFNPEDLIPDEQVIITMTQKGYIKRCPVEAYRKTNRGGKGVAGSDPDDDDLVIKVYSASTHDCLLVFTNQGNVYQIKVYSIPDTNRGGKGRALVNLMSLRPEEKVTSIIPIFANDFNDNKKQIVIATSLGMVKKSALSEYQNPRTNGIIGIKLNKGDSLVGAALTDGNSHLMLSTKAGYTVRFDENSLSSQNRDTAGRLGIRFKLQNDKVCSLLSLKPDDSRYILTFTKKGLGKRTIASEYLLHHYGNFGVLTTQVKDASELIATLVVVDEKDEVVIVTNTGKTCRINVKDIRISQRKTIGVKLMSLEEGQKVVDAAVVSPETLD